MGDPQIAALDLSMSMSAKLIFLCGKMAAGKSALVREVAQRENAVLLVQDDFLACLFPGELLAAIENLRIV